LKSIGLIGCGAIGTLIVEAIERGIVICDKLILYDLEVAKAQKLKKSHHVSAIVVKSVEDMIRMKPSVIVEAASQRAAKDYIVKIAEQDIDLIVMSVGALLDLDIKSGRIHAPSGAIGGLDALSTVDLAGIDEVVLTTRKNPAVLDMNNREEKLVYDGNVREAVKRFPREMNVAATLALTVGSEKIRVKVISDPGVSRNVHEINVRWKHGDMFMRFANDPHPDNPKTSALAAWSAIKLLKELLEESS
jgi:aspartate dehydrogenase